MDDKQLLRYSRHIMLDQVDVDGQEKLLDGHVLIIGAGGLGSPVATYLAGAGVGHLTICDDDEVDLTNLQRQILHRENRVGMKKVRSAAIAISEINPDCKVTEVAKRVGPADLATLVAAADVVVEASDNFATRHAVNRACVATGTPLVSGAAIRFAGQLSVFDPREESSPCYACLFPEDSDVPEDRCATMGVLAPLTGTIGSMQATETMLLLINGRSALTGRLQLYDAYYSEWQEMRIPRHSDCPVCGA